MLYFLIGADYRSIIADVSTGVEVWKLLKDEYQKDRGYRNADTATHLVRSATMVR
jgi:hypothetical protein